MPVHGHISDEVFKVNRLQIDFLYDLVWFFPIKRIRDEASEGSDRELAMDIQNLPFKYKQIILLYYYQGLNLREAAEALGISPATAQRQLKKAESLLKDGLSGGDWE